MWYHRKHISHPLLQIKELLQLCHRILRAGHRVSDCPRIAVDLVVVSSLVSLVTEEVDRLVLDTSRLLRLVLEVLQAVGLVPSGREHVEGYLAADREAVMAVSTRPGRQSCMASKRSTHVSPRCPKRSLSFSTNISRMWCSLSYFS